MPNATGSTRWSLVASSRPPPTAATRPPSGDRGPHARIAERRPHWKGMEDVGCPAIVGHAVARLRGKAACAAINPGSRVHVQRRRRTGGQVARLTGNVATQVSVASEQQASEAEDRPFAPARPQPRADAREEQRRREQDDGEHVAVGAFDVLPASSAAAVAFASSRSTSSLAARRYSGNANGDSGASRFVNGRDAIHVWNAGVNSSRNRRRSTSSRLSPCARASTHWMNSSRRRSRPRGLPRPRRASPRFARPSRGSPRVPAPPASVTPGSPTRPLPPPRA